MPEGGYWQTKFRDPRKVAIVQGGLNPISCGSANYYGAGLYCSVVQGRITSLTHILEELEPYDMLVNLG